jgi:hypothetical protein
MYGDDALRVACVFVMLEELQEDRACRICASLGWEKLPSEFDLLGCTTIGKVEEHRFFKLEPSDIHTRHVPTSIKVARNQLGGNETAIKVNSSAARAR